MFFVGVIMTDITTAGFTRATSQDSANDFIEVLKKSKSVIKGQSIKLFWLVLKIDDVAGGSDWDHIASQLRSLYGCLEDTILTFQTKGSVSLTSDTTVTAKKQQSRVRYLAKQIGWLASDIYDVYNLYPNENRAVDNELSDSLIFIADAMIELINPCLALISAQQYSVNQEVIDGAKAASSDLSFMKSRIEESRPSVI